MKIFATMDFNNLYNATKITITYVRYSKSLSKY